MGYRRLFRSDGYASKKLHQGGLSSRRWLFGSFHMVFVHLAEALIPIF
jgi:hypothetical protein